LEHIEWKNGIDSIIKFKPSNLYFIIQEQKDMDYTHTINTTRKLKPSIKKFAEIAHPQLIIKEELVNYLKEKQYIFQKKICD